MRSLILCTMSGCLGLELLGVCVLVDLKADILREDVKKEAQHFYGCLFGGQAPDSLISHYLNAHTSLDGLGNIPCRQQQTLNTIVNKKLDAAAIEPWLRGGNRRHALSAKLLLIAYLAECSNDKLFPRNIPAKGLGSLMWTAMRGGISLIRGRYLKIRYGLV